MKIGRINVDNEYQCQYIYLLLQVAGYISTNDIVFTWSLLVYLAIEGEALSQL